MGYVYILELKDDRGRIRYYVGSTLRSLKDRMVEHMGGFSGYTSAYPHRRLVWWMEVDNTVTRGIERMMKKDRRIVYQIVGKLPRGKRYENFIEKVKKYSGKVVINGDIGCR